MNHDKDKPTDQLEEQEIELKEVLPEESTKETVKDDVSSLKDQLLRALAEVDNIRKRAQKERDDAKKYAITGFTRDILVVADNLSRALKVVTPDQMESLPQEVKVLLEGVKMTEKELLSVFEKHGVKQVVPLGESFDHTYHQAMYEVETSDYPAGSVIEVMQPGYVLDDRLLRPAMVGVAKAPKEVNNT